MEEFSHHHRLKYTTFSIVFFFVLLARVPCSNSEIKTFAFTNTSDVWLQLDQFCFSKDTAHLSIAISSVAVHTNTTTTKIDPSRFGFQIIDTMSYHADQFRNNYTETHDCPDFSCYCSLDNPYYQTIFTFEDLSPPPDSTLNRTVPVSNITDYDFPPFINFVNCMQNTAVSMKVTLATYNLDSNGEKDYLPSSETSLPTLRLVSGILYFVSLAGWTYIFIRNKQYARKIHIIMGVLLLVKALNCLIAAEDKHFVKITGKPHGLDVFLYTFHAIRVTLMFTVVMLIGTGWSILKPCLEYKEKRNLIAAICLQVLTNVAYTVTSELSMVTFDNVVWIVGFIILDVFCCVIVLNTLRETMVKLKETSKTDGRALRNLRILERFKWFYSGVLIYIVYGRMFANFRFMLPCSLKWWLGDVCGEVYTLLFYMGMFIAFVPLPQLHYANVSDRTEEAALVAIHRFVIDD